MNKSMVNNHRTLSRPARRCLVAVLPLLAAFFVRPNPMWAQVCPASHYSLRFTDPSPIAISVNSDSTTQVVVFEGSALPVGCRVLVPPSSSGWSILDPSIASLGSCGTDSTCSVHGVSPGNTNLHVSASSTFLGLMNLEKMKPVFVTTTGQPPNQCLDSAGLVVSCGGDALSPTFR
jgi:hypothetical protein